MMLNVLVLQTKENLLLYLTKIQASQSIIQSFGNQDNQQKFVKDMKKKVNLFMKEQALK